MTHFRTANLMGRRVRLVGNIWQEEFKRRVGVVEGFSEGLLHVKWVGEERLRKFPLISPKHDIGEFQFQFCCEQDDDTSSLSENSNCDYEVDENILKTLPSFCCDPSDNCRGGQFVTHYEKSFLGLTVRHSRDTGLGTAVILGEEEETLKLKLKFWGENIIKKKRITKFVKGGEFAEYLFKFLCKKSPPLIPRVSTSSEVKTVESPDQTSLCKYCRQSPCAHLKKIFPPRISQTLIGCSGNYF